MAGPPTAAGVVSFGAFELDLRNGELRRSGVLVKLTPQQLKLLQYLVENPGNILTRDEIQRAIWGTETFVDFDRNLNVCVAQLRSVLNDDSEAPRFIQTVPRRGYRFVAPVSISGKSPPAPVVSPERRRVPTWAIVAIAAGVLAASGYFAYRSLRAPAAIRLAVLPFENLGDTAQDDRMADAFTDELITEFGSLLPARLAIIGRSSIMRFQKARPGLDQIQRDLQVDYVVEGAIRRSGDRARITARLVRVRDQVEIAAQMFELDAAELFQMQEQAAARITADTLKKLFPGTAASPRTHRGASTAAAEAYMDARYLQHKGQLTRSIEAFNRALKLDPSFADAYAGVADAYISATRSGRGAPDSWPLAKLAAETALRLDEANAEAHNALANEFFWHEWNWSEAERHFQRALAINPSLPLAHHDYAFFLVALGRTEQGLNSLRTAIALDPLSTRVNIDAGWLLQQAHQFDRAIAQARRALELEPGLGEAEACISRALVYQGRADAATRQRLRAQIDDPDRMNPFSYAVVCALMGQPGKALDALERAYATKSSLMPLLQSEPAFIGLHSDPRFRALVERLRFP